MINRAGVDECGRDEVQCCCKLGGEEFDGVYELKGSCMALGGVGNNFGKKVPFRSTENEDIDSLKL